MSNLTFKIKHDEDFSTELSKAKQVAEFAIKYHKFSSKDVKHFGLKSAISNQVLRKYGKNKKTKKIKNVKLIISGHDLSFKNKEVYVSSLKFKFPFYKSGIIKINQIEIDNNFVYVCCQVEDKESFESKGFIGIDRNATGHIAVCAIDNKILKLGKQAPHINRKYKSIRRNAQSKKKYSFLKKLKDKESRTTNDINHKISRKIVNIAYEKQYSIKLEKLTGINKKKTKSKVLNGIKSNWSFYKLQQYIEYKARLLGVKVFYVDPAYTSQTCSKCGLIGTRNKKVFQCQHCGHNDHSDANASFNIAKAGALKNGRLNKDRDLFKSQIDFKSTTDLAQVAILKND